MDPLIKVRLYHAAIYIRLSKEDGDKEESDSIINQRELIKNYLKEHADIQICMECVDDGYSGVNFDRPNFKKMIKQVELGKIDCIVVKDLSRFGRNFIETGRYLDQIFPTLGIRFISIHDSFDSINGRTFSDRILIPFKNLMNDAYCRDISIKVRSQLEVKRKKGDFIGSFAVYGYQKNPDNRHQLAVDDFAASIVKCIFKWKLEGTSQQRIADRLNEQGILSPLEYKRFCGMKYKSGFQINPKSKWSAVAINRILCNEVYLGALVQGKRTTPNHKVKKTVIKPSEEWIRVENTHTAIIEKQDFIAVKRLLAQDTRIAPGEETLALLSGLVFCGDCHSNLIRNSVSKLQKTYTYYMCGNNRVNKFCTSHRIRDVDLEQAVKLSLTQQIQNLTDMERILTYIKKTPFQKEEVKRMDHQILKKQEEIIKYQHFKSSLYESLTDGLIEKTEYLQLKEIYEEKLQNAEASKIILKENLEKLLQNSNKNPPWIESFLQHPNIELLTRHMIITLIDHINIYEDYRIDICFQYQHNFQIPQIKHTNLFEKGGDFI